MSKKGVACIEAAVKVQELYARGQYISYSQLHSIPKTLPNLKTFITSFFTDYATFSDTFAARRVLRKQANEKARHAHNQVCITLAQNEGMAIEGRSLDAQQIEAVVASEDAQLVMAAAGSGKTMSLLAKCRYLVEAVGVPAHKIVTISFTKASATELAERLLAMGIEVQGKTFHALGNDILGKGKYTVVSNEAQQAILERIIKERLRSNATFARHYNDYLLHYFTMPTALLDVKSLEHMVRLNKTFQTSTLKQVSMNKSDYDTNQETFGGERVRSKEEQIIANFLYINGISYEYEKPFPGYAGYKPDFTITQFRQTVYLEHQGIDREGRTRADIPAKHYRKKVDWQRDYHQKGGTRLIETFSYEFTEGTLFTNLEKRLKRQGLEIKRLQETEIHDLLKKSYGNELREFNKLLTAYLGLLKTSELSLADVRQRASALKSTYQRQRTLAFLNLFEAVFEEYEATLKATDSIDFSDMIVMAADLLPSLAPGFLEYEYVLVDEVQDLSGARYRLLKNLLDRQPSAKLFAVGDDWQSIFRFAGSDLTLLQDFEYRFERHTRHSVIEQTHRFSDPLLGITSQFIKQNPGQVQKSPFSRLSTRSLLSLNNSASRQSDATALDTELRRLVDQYGTEAIHSVPIFLIGRYKHDIRRLVNYEDPRLQFRQLDDEGKRIEWTDHRTGLTLELTFMTMHASKGLTCDHAFIVNGNGGSRGVPAEREDDPVVHMLLAHEESFPNAEERRLFYVAMTRAKKSTTIIYCAANPSPFIDELDIDQRNGTGQEGRRCPECSSGQLVSRTGPYGEFFACTNYGYGCVYTEKVLK